MMRENWMVVREPATFLGTGMNGWCLCLFFLSFSGNEDDEGKLNGGGIWV